jgi:cell wall assembly regulator SMI1
MRLRFVYRRSMTPDKDEEFSKALDDIKEWFRDHDAAQVVDDLKPPATERALAALEATLGCRLSEELRWLYGVHDGQKDRESHPLFEDLVFCDLEYARLLASGMITAYFNPPAYVDPNTPLTAVELTSRWFPFANTSHVFLAANLDSGRVVLAQKDVPAIRVVAESVGDLVVRYASALWNEKYVIAGDPSLSGVKHAGMEYLKRYARCEKRNLFS